MTICHEKRAVVIRPDPGLRPARIFATSASNVLPAGVFSTKRPISLPSRRKTNVGTRVMPYCLGQPFRVLLRPVHAHHRQHRVADAGGVHRREVARHLALAVGAPRRHDDEHRDVLRVRLDRGDGGGIRRVGLFPERLPRRVLVERRAGHVAEERRRSGRARARRGAAPAGAAPAGGRRPGCRRRRWRRGGAAGAACGGGARCRDGRLLRPAGSGHRQRDRQQNHSGRDYSRAPDVEITPGEVSGRSVTARTCSRRGRGDRQRIPPPGEITPGEISGARPSGWRGGPEPGYALQVERPPNPPVEPRFRLFEPIPYREDPWRDHPGRTSSSRSSR